MNADVSASHLAALHDAAFHNQRAWSQAEFENLLAASHCHVISTPNGFALIRVIADEAELLTIAVHPDNRRTGLGRALLSQAIAKAKSNGATETFLEVAADNTAAISLYSDSGFTQIATRPQYYLRDNGVSVDALLMSYMFT